MEIKKGIFVCNVCNGKGMVEKYDPAQLREARKSIGVSLRKMAAEVGVSASFLSDVELGRRTPNEKIIAFLEKSL